MSGTGTEETVGQTEEKEKRVVKPTLKGLEHNLQMKITDQNPIISKTAARLSVCLCMTE